MPCAWRHRPKAKLKSRVHVTLHPSEMPLSLVVYVQHIRCWYDAGSGGVEGSILCLLVGQVLGSCYSGVGRDVDQHCRLPRREVLYDDVPVYCTGSTSLVILETSVPFL